MPTEQSLAILAPDKKREDMIRPMQYLDKAILDNREEKRLTKKAPLFAPAGQSTQMVIGATPETDLEILSIAGHFYRNLHLKRVYYSGYVPISSDNRLPAIGTPVPFIRENRLYQADWLMRFYHFRPDEIVNPGQPLLDMEVDPKLNWALQNLHLFPVDINTADYHWIMRIPGIGIQNAKKICAARRYTRLTWQHLKQLGVSVNRARYFAICRDAADLKDLQPHQIRQQILAASSSKYQRNFSLQLNLF
jgi:predicted DNA-binding helix-hairpin-helix protein